MRGGNLRANGVLAWDNKKPATLQSARVFEDVLVVGRRLGSNSLSNAVSNALGQIVTDEENVGELDTSTGHAIHP